MKFTSRGFTLVELMIVIAIIGILAAALFPSMTGYLKRSRDAARTSHLKDISTALGAYYADTEKYPTANTTTRCFADASFSGKVSYFPKGMPKDPSVRSTPSVNGCTDNGQYGYNTGTLNGNSAPTFQIGATFENDNGGNTGSTIIAALSATNYASNLGISKGAGSGFILGN